MRSSPMNTSRPGSAQRNLKDVLRERQQNRNSRSCLPCRERKVKCDHQLPCGTCNKRGHPDLCSYPDALAQDSPSSSRSRSLRARGTTGPNITQAQGRTDLRFAGGHQAGSPVEDENSGPGIGVGASTSRYGASSQAAVVATMPLMGGNTVISQERSSVPTSNVDHERQRAYDNGILPLLGLEDDDIGASAAPLESDYDPLYKSLPGDEDLVILFENHRIRCNPFHIVTYDMDCIQSKVCHLISARKDTSGPSIAHTQQDPRWICLLHAILAAGAQSSDLPLERRSSLSQTHTKHAFESLRASNYLAYPFKEALQTLLLLSYVLQNDMKPQAAWILQGSTIRLALCLGVHERTGRRRNAPIPPEEARKLRLAIVWQDALLSLAFDRPPASQDFDFEEDLPDLHVPVTQRTMTYHQAMSCISHLGLQYLSRRDRQSPRSSAVPSLIWQDLELIEINILPRLNDVKHCKKVQELQEYHSFKLHRNFFAAAVCRQLISPRHPSELDAHARSSIMAKVQQALRNSAQAYLDLRSLSSYARCSWAFIHNGLACVLLLSLIPSTRCTTETRRLQDGFVKCIEASAGSDCDTLPASYLSLTLRKALRAILSLRKLSDGDTTAIPQNQQSSQIGNTNEVLGNESDLATFDDRRVDGGVITEQPNMLGASDWSIPFELGISPLETFDYIMFDTYGAEDNQFPFT